MELTAHRTLALRDAFASNPHVAMTAVLHKLCVDTFQREMSYGCLQVSVRQVHFSAQASDLKESASAKAIDDRNKAWAADMPNDEVTLWDWLAALDDASRSALLAHCVSFGVNALFEKVDRYGGNGVSSHGLRRRLDQADRLARAVNLDMVEAGWRPTVDNYLGRVTKSRILEAVREAKGELSAQLIDHLKKAEMAKEAERLLDGTGWLPEPLRLAEFASASDGSDSTGEPLPEFLADDEDEADEDRAKTNRRTSSPPNDSTSGAAPAAPLSSTKHRTLGARPSRRASSFQDKLMTDDNSASVRDVRRHLVAGARTGIREALRIHPSREQGGPVRRARPGRHHVRRSHVRWLWR